MNKKTEKVIKRYNRISKIFNFIQENSESMKSDKWRKTITKNLKGKVLEVGVGSGKNISLYPENTDITAIDFSPRMLEMAKKKALKYDKNVKLVEMDAQNMSFPDNTFDSIFTTCVFCTVPDPVKGFEEIRRVCKPNGKIYMLEHVRSEKKMIGILMDIMNPVVNKIVGSNINRDTVSNIKKAGFEEIEVNNLLSDIVKNIVIVNKK